MRATLTYWVTKDDSTVYSYASHVAVTASAFFFLVCS